MGWFLGESTRNFPTEWYEKIIPNQANGIKILYHIGKMV
jgi:hypothetical protein